MATASCTEPNGGNDIEKDSPISPQLPQDGEGTGMPEPFLKGEMFTELRQHTTTAVGEDSDPCISPDGKTLVFASTQHTETYNLYSKAVESRVLRQLTADPGDERFPRFSPDGTLLAYAATMQGNWDIFVGNAEDPRAARCITLDSKDNEICPTWSPDGKRIAYCSYVSRTKQWELFVHDLVRNQRGPLGAGFLPAWHPKRNVIAFQKARRRDPNWYAIWTIDLGTNQVSEIVAHSDWAAVHPAWSTCGNYLLFATVGKGRLGGSTTGDLRPDNVWVVASDGMSPAQITSDGCANSFPVWGPDGRLFFVSERNGIKNVWSARPLLPEMMEEPEE